MEFLVKYGKMKIKRRERLVFI